MSASTAVNAVVVVDVPRSAVRLPNRCSTCCFTTDASVLFVCFMSDGSTTLSTFPSPLSCQNAVSGCASVTVSRDFEAGDGSGSGRCPMPPPCGADPDVPVVDPDDASLDALPDFEPVL